VIKPLVERRRQVVISVQASCRAALEALEIRATAPGVARPAAGQDRSSRKEPLWWIARVGSGNLGRRWHGTLWRKPKAKLRLAQGKGGVSVPEGVQLAVLPATGAGGRTTAAFHDGW